MLKPALAFAPLLACSAAGAHDFWIEPSGFRPPPGASVSAKLRVGVDFEGEIVPRDDTRLVRLTLTGPRDERALAGRDGAEPAGVGKLGEAGLYVLAYQSRPADVDLDAAKIALYTKEEGLEPFLRLTPQERAAGIVDHYARSAKALLAVGPKAAQAPGFDRRLGLPLELVPEKNPYALGLDGKLPLRLLRDGKPVKDVLVTALRKDAPEARVSARTDAAGKVSLPLDGSGVWLVKAVHLVRGKGPREWESRWASLTFETP